MEVYSNDYYKVLGIIKEEWLIGRIIESKTDLYKVGERIRFPLLKYKMGLYSFKTNLQLEREAKLKRLKEVEH